MANSPIAHHTAALATRLRVPSVLKAPGVYDGLSALLVEQAGFECAFVSGAGISFARFGRPDMGLVSVTEVAQTVAAMRERVNLPLLVDMDTGFGNALNVQRSVRALERAGASALQMEDQSFPKRCGHMAGKTVISTAEMVGKIHAALDALEAGALLIARTDALATEGLDATLERGERYLEAGADALFIDAPQTLEQVQTIGDKFGARTPLVYNLLEGGKGDLSNADELEALGFRIALYPIALLHRAIPAMTELLQVIARDGATSSEHDNMLDIQRMNDLLGAPQLLAAGERYQGEPQQEKGD